MLYLGLDIWTMRVGFTLWSPATAQTKDAGKNAAPNTTDQAVLQDLSQRLEGVGKRLDSMPQAAALENRAADLQKLLAALVTVGTIFGLALGFATYVNLKDTQQNAEKLITVTQQNAKELIENVRQHAESELAEIRADFPAIARLNRKIAAMLEELRSYGTLRLEELGPDTYAGFSPDDKEEILLREMTFNALDFFDYGKVEALQGSAAEAFVTFGHFYGARYMSDQVRHSAAFHRAVIYLDRALENGKAETAVRVRSALGILYIWQSNRELVPSQKKKLLERAKQHLNAVLAGNELDPRCLIAAAWIDRREDRMDEAIGRLSKLIQAAADEKLTRHQVERFLGQAQFNRACYYALSGNLDQAMQDLWDSRSAAPAAGDGREKWIKKLKDECEPQGDLAAISAEARYQGDFKKMQDANYTPPPTPAPGGAPVI